MRKTVNDLDAYWDNLRTKFETIRTNGIALIYVKRERVCVVSPYNERFTKRARELSGRWRYRTKQWTFSINALRLVVDICVEVYGNDHIRIVKNMKDR